MPWESSSLTGDFYFTGGNGAEKSAQLRPVGPSVDPAAVELSYWDTIKNSTDPADF